MRAATRHLLAVTEDLDAGEWQEADWPSEVRKGIGLLVIEGLLLRRVSLNGRSGAELVGRGDLLRPWQREEDALASISHSAGWRVLQQPTTVARLDLGFAQRL